MLDFKKPHTLTQAYHAGVLISQIENYLTEDIPPIGVCLANFHSLRELLGDRLWQKIKSRAKLVERVKIYEAFSYHPFLPKEMIGSGREFCLGYATSYVSSSRKYSKDQKVLKHADTILTYVRAKLGHVEID